MTEEQQQGSPVSATPSSSGSLPAMPNTGTNPYTSGNTPASATPYQTYSEQRFGSESAYVRQPRPRANQGTINDVAPTSAGAANIEPEPVTLHDSSFTLNSHSPLQSRSYRRARADQLKVSRESKYGQYLSVPKGSREIFASRERLATQRKIIAAIVVIAIVVILIIVFWPK